MHLIEMPSQLLQGDVRRLLDQPQDLDGMGLDPMRALIPTLRPWPDMAGLTPLIDPFDGRRRRDPEPRGRGAP